MKNTLKLLFFFVGLFIAFVSLRMVIDVAFYSDVIGIRNISFLGITSILFTISAFFNWLCNFLRK